MKKIFVLILSLAFVFGLTMPTFAVNPQDDQIKIVLSANNDPVAHILPDLDIFGIDVGSLSVLSNGTGEVLTDDLPTAPDFSRIDMTRSLTYVTTYAGLSSAVSDSTITSIVIMNDIVMSDCLEITRDINFLSGANNAVTLTSAVGERHFEVEEQDDIDIVFNNVILDGNNAGGGIEIVHSRVSIYGAHIKDCDSGIGGAIAAFNQKVVFYSEDDYEILTVGSLRISNSTIEDNVSDTMGGAVASFGILTITNSTLSGNYAEESGGAIYMLNISSGSPVLSLSDVTVEDNESGHFGGGVFVFGTTVNISDSEISGNVSTAGGGLYSFICTTSITGSQIMNNYISSTNTSPTYEEIGGAGIHASGRLEIDDSFIENNTANMPVCYGVGILMVDDALFGTATLTYHYPGTEELIITNSYITGNENLYNLSGSNFRGGGVAALGVPSSFGITNGGLMEIAYNTATYGGGVYSTSTVTVDGAYIHDNVAENYTASVGYGGGLYIDHGSFTFLSGEIYTNYAVIDGGGVYLDHSALIIYNYPILQNIYGNYPNEIASDMSPENN